jgi:hypothetical protein
MDWWMLLRQCRKFLSQDCVANDDGAVFEVKPAAGLGGGGFKRPFLVALYVEVFYDQRKH